MERADEEDLDAAIAEEEEEYGFERLGSVAESETEAETDTLDCRYRDGDDDSYSERTLLPSLSADDSATVRAMREERIIKRYLLTSPPPPSSSSSSRLSTATFASEASSTATLKHKTGSVYRSNSTSQTSARNSARESGNGHGYGRQDGLGVGVGYGYRGEGEGKKRASEWARSYGDLVERF